MNTCSIPDCGKPVNAHGWCQMHYWRWKRTSSTDERPRTVKTCSIPECDKPIWGKGWCRGHYMRWRRTGDPLPQDPRFPSTEERFWSHVEKTDTCWLWRGAKHTTGYGMFKLSGRSIPAHIYAYEQFVAPIPPGHVLATVCGQHACIRPDPRHRLLAPHGYHFDPVYGLISHFGSPGQCRNGHPRTPDTTRRSAGGKIICLLCRRERKRRQSQAPGSVS